jgi:hypothetical protein
VDLDVAAVFGNKALLTGSIDANTVVPRKPEAATMSEDLVQINPELRELRPAVEHDPDNLDSP